VRLAQVVVVNVRGTEILWRAVKINWDLVHSSLVRSSLAANR
jgi:hypothetical protein